VKQGGSTDIWAGIEKGAELVHTYQKEGYNQRMFLFSDGLVNAGLTDKQKIKENVADKVYTQKKTRLSAFGIGNDFDEELMKSLAEYGNGSYFFIYGLKAIPEFVNFALKGLTKIVGSDTSLSVQGVNGGVVTAIYSQEKSALISGVRLDDLRQENSRMVVAQLEVTPSRPASSNLQEAEGAREEVFRYVLTYKDMSSEQAAKEERVQRLEGSLEMRFTTDAQVVLDSKNSEVMVAVAVQQTAEIDQKVIQLIDRGQRPEAIAALETQIKQLESVLELDTTGVMVRSLLKDAEKRLERIKKEGLTKQTRKEAHHGHYMKQKGCMAYYKGHEGIDQD